MVNKPSKYYQISLHFCQNGEILLNLVTLIAGVLLYGFKPFITQSIECLICSGQKL